MHWCLGSLFITHSVSYMYETFIHRNANQRKNLAKLWILQAFQIGADRLEHPSQSKILKQYNIKMYNVLSFRYATDPSFHRQSISTDYEVNWSELKYKYNL